jgi:indole-3-glycerol phosphate synthase
MTAVVPDILARIVARKREELEEVRPQAAELRRIAMERRGDKRDFAAQLRRIGAERPAVIAEVKKASPSRGLLAAEFRPVALGLEYELGGAACVSVLTDRDFFQGSLEDMDAVRGVISLPVIRKDFTLEPVDLYLAAARGADAVLLIAALLEEGELRDLRGLASELGMAALVEVHDEAEMDKAVASGAELIGVNNRNLRTFEVTLETSLRLAALMPAGVIAVSESGIFTRQDVELLRGAGYQAFLVGESLMKAASASAAVRELCG